MSFQAFFKKCFKDKTVFYKKTKETVAERNRKVKAKCWEMDKHIVGFGLFIGFDENKNHPRSQ